MIGGFLPPFAFGADTRQALASELRAKGCAHVNADALLDAIEALAPPWIASASADAKLPAARDTQRLLTRIEGDAQSLLERLDELRDDARARRLLWHGANDPERTVVKAARETLAALQAVARAAARHAKGKPGTHVTPQATVAMIAAIADAFEEHGGAASTTGRAAFEGVVAIVVPPLLEAAGRHARESYHDLIVEALRDRR